jgi:ABC-type phosphate transport system ATPase subunit
MSTLLFYQGQAAKAQAEADAAILDNVRDRCLRSANAWNEMADRLQRTDKMRADREAREVIG